MMAARNLWRGGKAFRRVMKGLPVAVHREMEDVLEDGGRDIRRLIVAKVRRRTGALARGIQYRLLRKTLRLRVGLIGSPRARAKLFYGRILDLGRKAQTVKVTRRNTRPYVMRVRRIAPQRFITGSYAAARSVIQRRLRGVWDRALRAVAGGGND